MTSIKLLMNPYMMDSQEIILEKYAVEKNILDIEKKYDSIVYSDLTYEASVVLENYSEIDLIEFRINDIAVDFKMTLSGTIIFNDASYGERIFQDCYGFVQISILVKINEIESIFESGYISVLVRKGRQNDSVQRMVRFIYENDEELLYNDNIKPKNEAGLKKSPHRNLESRIMLLENIALCYEENYRYFKTNSRFSTVSSNTIDDFEKAQFISKDTIQYISQHPEELIKVKSRTGIVVGQNYYQPKKTLVARKIYSYDIYENQIVVHFLGLIINEIKDMISKVQEVINETPSKPFEVAGYISSSYFMYHSTKQRLKEVVDKLIYLNEKYMNLYISYKKILDVKNIFVKEMPRPTPIFLSVPHYKKIYFGILSWFNYGFFDLKNEKFILTFVKISILYELYVLAKFIHFFKNKGFNFDNPKKIKYIVGERSLYKNTICNNTFSFFLDDIKLTLYYQPVVYDKGNNNNIGLYRNTSISFPKNLDNDWSGRYYTPDYILKIENKTRVSYVVMDAKFSTVDVVKRHQVAALAYKYLFSMSAFDEDASIVGLCIINGQSDLEEDRIIDIYDKKQYPNQITPYAEILTLTENMLENEINHIEILKKIFDKYLIKK